MCPPPLPRQNRVKKFIIWLCLTIYYLKSEPWRIGMNERVYWKAFKTQQFLIFHTKNLYRTRKSKNFQRNCLFSFSFKSFQLFESNVLSHFLYFRFTSRALTSLIMPVGITGRPRVLANHSARYIFTSSGHIINLFFLLSMPL